MNKREKEKLQQVFDVLENYTGDTDPYIPEDFTDAEIMEEEPLFWVTKEIAKILYGKDE